MSNTLLSIIQQFNQQEKGCCFYRYPGENSISFIAGTHNEKAEKGFQFVPFDANSKEFPSLMIEQEVRFSNSDFRLLLDELNQHFFRFKSTAADVNRDATAENEIDHGINLSNVSTLLPELANETSKEQYAVAYHKIQDSIQKGELSKAILSRIKKTDFTLSQLELLFTQLLATHQNALCYLFFHPLSGIWIGASPELLLGQEGNNFFTSSLAGTKSSESDSWGTKELDEQKIVTDYICKGLKSIGAIYQLSKLATAKAGTVFHLKQEISFQFTFENQKLQTTTQLLNKIVNQLHPTPAIGGFPKEAALSLIKTVEQHQRGYYCGYIGEINSTWAKIFVNLRCAQVGAKALNLHIGGGITKDSVMELEWLECERKAETLLQLIP